MSPLPDLVALLGELMKSALKSGQTLDRAGSGTVEPSMTRQRDKMETAVKSPSRVFIPQVLLTFKSPPNED